MQNLSFKLYINDTFDADSFYDSFDRLKEYARKYMDGITLLRIESVGFGSTRFWAYSYQEQEWHELALSEV